MSIRTRINKVLETRSIKPFGNVKLNLKHPLLKGRMPLVAAYMIPQNKGLFDYAGNRPYTKTLNPIYQKNVWSFDNTNQVLIRNKTSDKGWLSVSGLTVIWSGKITGSAKFQHFLGKHTGPGGNKNPCDFRTTDTSSPFRPALVRSSTADIKYASTETFSYNVNHLMCASAVDNIIDNGVAIYANGKQLNVVSSGVGTGAVTGNSGDVRIGARADNALNFTGTMNFVLALPFFVNFNWFKKFSENPYSLLSFN